MTGSVEDIRQVAREYRVYYMKTEDEGTDYLVDHSIITYDFSIPPASQLVEQLLFMVWFSVSRRQFCYVKMQTILGVILCSGK